MRSADPSRGTDRRPSARYLSLDLWRGLACLMVAVGHAAGFGLSRAIGIQDGGGETWAWLGRAPLVFLVSKGWTGVPIFFVISGYCITATADHSRRHAKGARDFLRRRVRRIYPPYWLMLAPLCVLLIVDQDASLVRESLSRLPRPSELSLPEWIGNLTLTATWLGNASGHEYRLLNTVAWTLCYEEQFYLLCCLLLALCSRRYFLAAALVSVAVPIVNRTAGHLGQASLLRGTFLDGRWLQFALGIGLYYVLNYLPSRRAWGVAFVTVTFAATLVAQALHPRVREPVLGNPVFELQICLLCTAALLLTHPWDGALYASRWAGPLRYCGRICYSLYLVHLPIVAIVAPLLYGIGLRSVNETLFLVAPIAVMAAVAVASAFFVVCERPFLNPRRPDVAPAP
jgi:peptidoglycan/LPS O-acetylase OafA/YrhL